MDKNKLVQSLNDYLQNEYRGIHTYECYIQQTQDPSVKYELDRIKRFHQQQAIQIANQIQNLGGQAVEEHDVMAEFGEDMMDVKDIPKSTQDILQKALKTHEEGLSKTEEILKGDLDSESSQMLDAHLNRDKKNLLQLNQLKRLDETKTFF